MPIVPDQADIPRCYRGSIPTSWEPLILPIDKGLRVTSFDVIRQIRRISTTRKIGHAGTLDPMATGLLICLCGRATKLMTHFMELRKVYVGTIRLGESTPSFDAETKVDKTRDATQIRDEQIASMLLSFTGDIRQTTPVYSAVKVGGERLYKKARRGERVKLPTRDVSVYRFEITGRTGADLQFEIECSRGTYIRSIAHEFGESLGVGGHLTELRRTAIGDIRVEAAWSIADLISSCAEGV